MKTWDNEEFWSKSGSSFNLDDDNRKYKFEDINRYSQRSNRPISAQTKSANVKSYQTEEPLSFTIRSENDIECPELICHACQMIIVDHDLCKYEGNKVFSNEICWKHWIDKMTELDQINVHELVSLSSKQYCLERVSATCNGQMILKVILALKGAMQQFEFGTLLYDNPRACNHYIAFLKETRQTDDKLLRCKYQIEEAMSKLRELFSDNARVSSVTVHHFMTQLNEFRDERLLNLNMPLQCEMIKEYINLLEWQDKNNQEYINAPLIETLISNNVSYQAIKDTSKAKYLKDTYRLTSEEFVWTSLKSIVDKSAFSEIDHVFSHKIMGNRPDISIQRIVAYLVFLDKEPNEMKMRFLTKISDINDLVDCANMWKLLPAYMEYCKRNKDNNQMKKIQQVLQGNKR